MSLQGIAAFKAANRILPSETNDLLRELNRSIRTLIDTTPKYRPLLKSNNNNLSSNVADGVEIIKGAEIPTGHVGVFEDFNINFTTAAGTVRLVILDSGGNIRTDILRDINSSTNGTGRSVLESGEAIAIVGQSAGAGTFSAYVSGFLQKRQTVG